MPTKARSKPPRIHAGPNTPRAAKPGAKLQHPWRFKVGEWARVCNFPEDEPVEIVDGSYHGYMPHFVVRTKSGDYWRIPQLHLRDLP